MSSRGWLSAAASSHGRPAIRVRGCTISHPHPATIAAQSEVLQYCQVPHMAQRIGCTAG